MNGRAEDCLNPFSKLIIYDMANRRTQMNLPDGTKWRYGYDRLSQVVSGERVDATTNEPVSGGSFRYAYDGIAISMDGRGRAFDNIFTERFWRNLKYEWLYLNSFDSIKELRSSLDEYIEFYNFQRIHQALDYKTPNEVYSMVA